MRHRLANGPAIRSRRGELKIRQKDLAEALGKSTWHINRIEAGTDQPSDPLMADIALQLECTVEELSTPKPAAEPRGRVDTERGDVTLGAS